MMARCGKVFPIRMMDQLLHVCPSGYYAGQRRPLGRRTQENAQLIQEIRRIHTASDGIYGSPKLWQELQERGHGCGKHRVARLMKQEELQGITLRTS